MVLEFFLRRGTISLCAEAQTSRENHRAQDRYVIPEMGLEAEEQRSMIRIMKKNFTGRDDRSYVI